MIENNKEIEEDQLDTEYNRGFKEGFRAGLEAAKEAIIVVEEENKNYYYRENKTHS